MSSRPATAPATWTDARIELLKQLWGEGASCSQIATALGGLSRNAVIGKVHRLALPRPERKRARPPRQPRQPRGGAQVELTRLAPFTARGSGKSKLRAPARAAAQAPIAAAPGFPRGARSIQCRHPIRAAAHAVAAHPIELPLAGRRAGRAGLLLLRGAGRGRPSVLRRPLWFRLSTGGSSWPQPARRCDRPREHRELQVGPRADERAAAADRELPASEAGVAGRAR